eukprot:COSAG03_NODE_4161_length_1656_cov_3.524727_1_plen_89_part_10
MPVVSAREEGVWRASWAGKSVSSRHPRIDGVELFSHPGSPASGGRAAAGGPRAGAGGRLDAAVERTWLRPARRCTGARLQGSAAAAARR